MTMLVVNLVILIACISLQCGGRVMNPPDRLVKLTSIIEPEPKAGENVQGVQSRHHHGSITVLKATPKRTQPTKRTRTTIKPTTLTTKISSTEFETLDTSTELVSTEDSTITDDRNMDNQQEVQMYRSNDSDTTVKPVVILTKSTTTDSPNLNVNINDWDEMLAWRLPFGDPRRPFPMTNYDYNKFCEMFKEQNITEESEVKFYNQLYPDNVVVQKIAKIIAKVDKEFVKVTCTEDTFKRAGSISQIGASINHGARYSKIHRDAFVENLMFYYSYPEESKMSTLICVIKYWAMRTLAKYPDEFYLREYMIDSVGKIVSEVIKVLQQETNTTPDTSCELTLLRRKSKENPPKSLQLLVLKAVDSLTKKNKMILINY